MKCPDFGWDRVNFFFVAGTMLCFGFSVRMRLITRWLFCLLLNSAYPKSRIFHFGCSASEEVHQKLGGIMACSPDLNCPKGYSIPQNIILTYQTWELPGERLGMGQWVVSHCIVHRLSLLGFISLSLLLPSLLLLFLWWYFTLFQLLNWFYINPWLLVLFSLFSTPFHWWGGGAGEWVDCRVYDCCLGLNHDGPFWPPICGDQRVEITTDLTGAC